MPNKFSHALVFSQQQYRDIIYNDHPPSLRPPPSPDSRSRTRSTASSIRAPSTNSIQSSGYLGYLHLEPDSEREPSDGYRTSSHSRRPRFSSIPSDAPRFESASSERSRPPSDRLRLESPFGFRTENPTSPTPKLERTLSEHPYLEYIPSHRPGSESSPPERLRLGSPVPPRSENSRPSLHRKSSSVETQIYAPEPTTSPPPRQGHPNVFSVETHEPYTFPPSTHERQYHYPVALLQERQTYLSQPYELDSQHRASPASPQERQHASSMELRESSPPPISTGDRQERFSSETQRAYPPSPIRDRQESFIPKIQALASPSSLQGRQSHSPFGTPDSPLFPSAQELEDYFSIWTHGSRSTPAATENCQDFSSMKALSALPAPSQDGHTCHSKDMQPLQLSPRTQDHQRRPSLGTQNFSSERGFQTTQKLVHGRRQSTDPRTTRDRQQPPSLGPQHAFLDESVKEPLHSRRQSMDSKTAQERQPRPSLSSQQLSLEQFIRESEHMGEPSIGGGAYSPQLSSLSMGKSGSHRATSANAQRYTPKGTSLVHSPRSRWDRPSKLPSTFASQHRTLLPTRQGAYDNVFIETHGFPPERPPSPPATPDSSKSSSVGPQAEERQRTRPHPLITRRSARHSPAGQRSKLRSTNSSVVYLPSEHSRSKMSSPIDSPTNTSKATVLHSPTFSISTRTSSISATTSPQSMSPSNFGVAMTSPQRVSFSQSRNRKHFEDADLQSQPPETDYNVLPYEDPNVGPAIFRVTQLGQENPVSPRYEDPNAGPANLRATQQELGTPISHDRPVVSRASSFDSAAPPPIGLKRRTSHTVAEPYQQRMPKKDSKLSLLSFLRSTSAPKAVLYSEATQGIPPVNVAVSRTAVPSIPLLFPDYRGEFPPSQKMQDKGMKSGLEPRRSVARDTAHTEELERKKSWFKGDDVNKCQGGSRQENKAELERILSRL